MLISTLVVSLLVCCMLEVNCGYAGVGQGCSLQLGPILLLYASKVPAILIFIYPCLEFYIWLHYKTLKFKYLETGFSVVMLLVSGGWFFRSFFLFSSRLELSATGQSKLCSSCSCLYSLDICNRKYIGRESEN